MQTSDGMGFGRNIIVGDDISTYGLLADSNLNYHNTRCHKTSFKRIIIFFYKPYDNIEFKRTPKQCNLIYDILNSSLLFTPEKARSRSTLH